MVAGKTSILLGYPLGKAQRLLFHLDQSIGRILAHGSVWNTNAALLETGIGLPNIERVTPDTDKAYFRNSLILAPPSALGSPWIKKFKPYSAANASGWMNLRGAKRRKPVDRGFVLSDHADWEGLLSAVKATGAGRIFATHGYKSSFSLYLREQGYEAYEVNTLWEGEVSEEKGDVNEN
jgi:putative mRNA 3-end processing factor